jgi:hypothetical protein
LVNHLKYPSLFKLHLHVFITISFTKTDFQHFHFKWKITIFSLSNFVSFLSSFHSNHNVQVPDNSKIILSNQNDDNKLRKKNNSTSSSTSSTSSKNLCKDNNGLLSFKNNVTKFIVLLACTGVYVGLLLCLYKQRINEVYLFHVSYAIIICFLAIDVSFSITSQNR